MGCKRRPATTTARSEPARREMGSDSRPTPEMANPHTNPVSRTWDNELTLRNPELPGDVSIPESRMKKPGTGFPQKGLPRDIGRCPWWPGAAQHGGSGGGEVGSAPGTSCSAASLRREVGPRDGAGDGTRGDHSIPSCSPSHRIASSSCRPGRATYDRSATERGECPRKYWAYCP